MDSLTAKRSKDSGRFTNAKASPALTAAHAFGGLITAGDRLTGVQGVSEDDELRGWLKGIKDFIDRSAVNSFLVFGKEPQHENPVVSIHDQYPALGFLTSIDVVKCLKSVN